MRQRPTQTERANSAAREQSWAWIYGLLHEHHGLAVASLARTSPHGSSRTSRPAPASARVRETTVACNTVYADPSRPGRRMSEGRSGWVVGVTHRGQRPPAPQHTVAAGRTVNVRLPAPLRLA